MGADPNEIITLKSVNWTDCGLSNKTLSFTQVTLTPDPVKPGQHLKIVKEGSTTEKYSNVTFDVSNYYILFGKKIRFVHFVVPLCGDEIDCPFGPGQFIFNEGHGSIPIISPS